MHKKNSSWKNITRFAVLTAATIALGVLMAGCSIGPLYLHETASTVGKSKMDIATGYGDAGPVLKLNYGLTENLDIGYATEVYSTGIRAKYAFINGKEGEPSLATAAGAGVSPDGNHYYVDLIGGYQHGDWEPYGSLRYVRVNFDATTYDSGFGDFKVDKSHSSYGQYFLGLRYWVTQRWFLSLEASQLSFNPHAIAGAAVGYRY